MQFTMEKVFIILFFYLFISACDDSKNDAEQLKSVSVDDLIGYWELKKGSVSLNNRFLVMVGGILLTSLETPTVIVLQLETKICLRLELTNCLVLIWI